MAQEISRLNGPDSQAAEWDGHNLVITIAQDPDFDNLPQPGDDGYVAFEKIMKETFTKEFVKDIDGEPRKMLKDIMRESDAKIIVLLPGKTKTYRLQISYTDL